MKEWVFLSDYILVCIYGCVLSVVFAMGNNRNNILNGLLIAITTLFLQGGIYIMLGLEFIQHWYPVIVHLPLLFYIVYKRKSILWSLTSVFTAYLCCQLRRWISLMIISVINNDDTIFTLIQILITLPILYLLIRFVAPAMQEVSKHSRLEIVQFMLIGGVYYIFDYTTTVYTDILYGGSKVVVEFMPFICCVAYFIFVLYTSEEGKKRTALEMERNQLDILAKQSIKELESFRKSQDQAIKYRHDLRHHLQYILECLENHKTEQVQQYIKRICNNIEAQKVVVFCENEAVNLILSAYAGQTANQGIEFSVKLSVSKYPFVSPESLCVLLSNALENAVNECKRGKESGKVGKIEIQGYEKNGKLMIQISNTCYSKVFFENGIPVTKKEGHGIGIRSIVSVVDFYHGVCSFDLQDNQFIFRVAI